MYSLSNDKKKGRGVRREREQGGERERVRERERERERLLLGENVMELHTHQSIFWCKLTCGYLSTTEMCSVVYHQYWTYGCISSAFNTG